jgi:signal transduction histidine kinase
MRVLVIDDDEVDRMACRRSLMHDTQAAQSVDEAATGEQALVLLADHRFDIVLLDLRLPDRQGLALLDEMKSAVGDALPPVVVMTGATDVEQAVQAMRRGASDYVVKDVQGRYQAQMPAVIQRALRERALSDEKRRAETALARSREELRRLTQRLIAQEKATARRIAQSLHDRLGQTLTALRLSFDAVQAVPDGAQRLQALQRHGGRIGAFLDQAMQEVRQVMTDLRPPLLDEEGLAAALDNELRWRAPVHAGVALQMDRSPRGGRLRWPAEVEFAAFMVAREALANALAHSGGRHVWLRLDGDAHSLRLEVLDDGRGIAEASEAARSGHLGLIGMRERASAIGAMFDVSGNAHGGTTVSLHWRAAP